MINFSDRDNLSKLINIEKSSLSATLSIQKSLNKQILIFMKTFIGNIEVTEELDSNGEALKYITESAQTLNKSNTNIKSLKKLLTHLDKLSEIKEDTLDKKSEKLIETYNSQFTKTVNSIHDNTKVIEDFIHEISLLDIPKTLEKLNTPKEKTLAEKSKESVISEEELSTSFIENTLVISEFKQKVILPYKLEDIEKILVENKNTYSSIQDIIDKMYTKPLNYYKVASLARFKETYKLVVMKAKLSRRKALSLATELFFNYNLHPAIISACNSLDELDVYLACLDDNTLEDFHFFDIKFEMPPALLSETE